MKTTTKLTAIGNSQGIRIPQHILRELGIENHVLLEVKGKSLIISPLDQKKQKRVDWNTAFSSVVSEPAEAAAGIAIADHSWDEQEWEW